MLSTRFVRGLFLSPLVANDWPAALSFGPQASACPPGRHACRPCPVGLPNRLLLPFENSGWPQLLEPVIVRQCARIALGRSTALQRVRGACRRTFVLVAQLLFSQVPKFSFSIFGPTRLLPKLIRSRVDFLFAGFSHYVFSELQHDPPFRSVGDLPADVRPAWRPAFRIQVYMKPLVPR